MTEARGPILEVDGLHRSFGGIHAVRGASFEVARGSITALIGPNGAGKTTLFNVVTGFYRADRGSVRLNGREVAGTPPHRLAALGMVRTFQITKALTAMPVIDNMMLAAPRQPGERLRSLLLRPRAARRRETAVRERACELLADFGLEPVARAYAGELSGGQRKLLELARALMAEPELLMLDEPMAGVNPALGERLLDHIERLRTESGTTVLFIEHDMDAVMGRSDRVIVMADGQVIASGTPASVRTDKRVVDVYLGGTHSAASGERPRLRPAPPAEAREVVLEAEELVAGYLPGVNVLNGVSLVVRRGEVVTVIGPNGAGKSTLIKAIFGLLPLRSGRVAIRDEELGATRPHEIARRGVAYVPQLENVFKSLTVEENLEVGSLDPSRTKARMDAMYELFPRLRERRRQAAGTMSGGERQMLAMARALMPEPDIVLLDEPSAGLAPERVEATFAQIERISATGATIVMVEQNARRALEMSDRGYVLDMGANRFGGSGRELLENPKVVDLYLGGAGRPAAVG